MGCRAKKDRRLLRRGYPVLAKALHSRNAFKARAVLSSGFGAGRTLLAALEESDPVVGDAAKQAVATLHVAEKLGIDTRAVPRREALFAAEEPSW